VVVLDRTNVRYLEALPEPIDIVTIDVSFISLALVLPAALRVLKPDGSCVALIKPQFEAGREKVGKGGVVRDPRVHREVLRRVLTEAQSLGFTVRGLTPSPIRGPAGNVERSEEHTSELQSRENIVCRLLLEKKNAPAGLAARP